MRTILYNAKIYTCDSNLTVQESMVVDKEKVIATGSNEKIMEKYSKNAEIIDMNGKCILPGLIDSHLHFTALAQSLTELSMLGEDKTTCLDMLRKAIKKAKPNELIMGRGFNNELWNEDLPNKAELDKIAPNNPVIIFRTCGHLAWVNTVALEKLDINSKTNSPNGGEILKDEDGNPNGILTETAMNVLTKLMDKNALPNYKHYVAAVKYLNSLGLTSVGDAGTTIDMYNEYMKLYTNNDLTIKIHCMRDCENNDNYKLPIFAKDPLMPNMRCAKLYSDGSLGARGAYLTFAYNDRPGHFGTPRMSEQKLCEKTKRLHELGYQVAIHAIGDAAIKQCIKAISYAQKGRSSNFRHRIEHFQINNMEDILWAKKENIIISMQSCNLSTDWRMAEKKLGTRKEDMYRFRDIIDSGQIISNGSDCPVEPCNPFFGLYAAVARKDRQGNPKEGYVKSQAMSRMEALLSFTKWAAYAQFDETFIGSLEKEKYANFICIDKDYFKCHEDEIKDIQVMQTWYAGKKVYEQ